MARERTITAMIVDDEPLARHGLRAVLSAIPDVTIIAEASDGEEALSAVAEHHPDVLFLDIQMPEMDGFEFLRTLPAEEMPLVVFVTAYDEFAVKAFDARALDYILKPFDEMRITASLSRVRELLRLKEQAAYSRRIEEIVRTLRPAKRFLERVMVRNSGKIHFVPVSDILWCEAAADYLQLHTSAGVHTIRGSIGSFEEQLDPARFIRIHRSTIVRLDAIRELRTGPHGEYTALLGQGTELAVSRSYKERIERLL
ncbi:MAG: response regulator transcription factor [Bacteroidetes bacterium]|nr:response regulator transcription factor [Bacteroidota bacterium]